MTVKEKILKIMALALEINPPEIHYIGRYKTAVFIEWAPHCNSFSVRIYYGGYNFAKEIDESYYLWTYEDESQAKLDEIIAKLEKIKADIEDAERQGEA